MFMRYRGGGVGHRILWPLRDIMLRVGHTRPKHQMTAKEDKLMGEAGEADEDDEEDDVELTDDGDLVRDVPDKDDGGLLEGNDAYEYDQELADEMDDYDYEPNWEARDDVEEEEEEEFDYFVP